MRSAPPSRLAALPWVCPPVWLPARVGLEAPAGLVETVLTFTLRPGVPLAATGLMTVVDGRTLGGAFQWFGSTRNGSDRQGTADWR